MRTMSDARIDLRDKVENLRRARGLAEIHVSGARSMHDLDYILDVLEVLGLIPREFQDRTGEVTPENTSLGGPV